MSTESTVELPGENKESKESKKESKESKETKVARLKRIIRRTERNRLKLKAVTEAIDHSCQLVRGTDTLYPIELFGM